ncbi:hypothetical protein [Streptomyces syringium]|uniref:hypothetical protein n=1 Tax=Streptomyces syringium TaxID=76729 RepID=UPI00343B6F29
MGNVFGGGGHDLYMSNGGTAVFADTLMLAVTALALTEWDYRFAALIARQDQALMGSGAVGFLLEDVGWGENPTEWARNKRFVLDVTALALDRHRWDELGYEPPFALKYLHRFRRIVAAFDPATAGGEPDELPAPHDVIPASCVRDRVLIPLAWCDVCMFCGRDRDV